MRTIVPLSEYGSGTTAATPTSDRGVDMAAAIGVCTQHGQHGGTTKTNPDQSSRYRGGHWRHGGGREN